LSQAERDKWNERYRSGSYEGRVHPTALLAEWVPRLTTGRSLDVACGAGRNALFLATEGYSVDAVDIAERALERGRAAAEKRGLPIRWIAADLDGDIDTVLPAASYDLIVWVRYVNAALMPQLLRRLDPGGHLICEQHLITTAEVVGPRGEEFRLQPGELRNSVAELEVLDYREGLVRDPDGRTAGLAQIVARRTA
jgi:tellurite methyltransferase